MNTTLRTKLNAIAVLERDGPMGGDRLSVHKRAVRAAQIGDLDDPVGTNRNPGVPSRDGDVVDLKVALSRAAEDGAAIVQRKHRPRYRSR